MTDIKQNGVRNLLLCRLEARSFAAIAPHLTYVGMHKREQLADANKPIERSYFLDGGIASVVATTRNGAQAEVGMIGREGFIHPSVILGAAVSPFDIFMRAGGHAYTLPTNVMVQLCDQHPPLRRILLDYVHVFLVQVSHTTVATASLSLREPLARWLLMSHDRVDGDELQMTHEFLSLMLTVRRPGITEAVQALEASGAIEGKRGTVVVRERDVLLKLAGGAYGGPEAEYQRLLAN